MIMQGNRKNAVTAILGPESPNVGVRSELSDSESPEELKMISQELIEAIHARNPEDVCQALKAAFELLDSEPHEEGPEEEKE